MYIIVLMTEIEAHKEKGKQYRAENKEEIKERKKEYYEEHKAQIAEAGKQYRETHKEEIKERKKKYREEHREEINLKKRSTEVHTKIKPKSIIKHTSQNTKNRTQKLQQSIEININLT